MKICTTKKDKLKKITLFDTLQLKIYTDLIKPKQHTIFTDVTLVVI